jgi:GNAT superfamily N-acetyltransferase
MVIREVNAADIAGIAKVQVDTWRSAYSGIVAQKYLNGMSYKQTEDLMAGLFAEGDKFCYLAEDASGKVIGFVAGGKERTDNPTYKGELYAVYVLDQYQRSGTGRLLFLTAARRLRIMGFNSMLVWVLAASPYRRFYAKLGGKELTVSTVDIGEEKHEVVSYGWDDISSFVRDA